MTTSLAWINEIKSECSCIVAPGCDLVIVQIGYLWIYASAYHSKIRLIKQTKFENEQLRHSGYVVYSDSLSCIVGDIIGKRRQRERGNIQREIEGG